MKYAKTMGVHFVAYGEGINANSPVYGCGHDQHEAFISLVLREMPEPNDIENFSLRERNWYSDAKRAIKEKGRLEVFSLTDAVGGYIKH